MTDEKQGDRLDRLETHLEEQQETTTEQRADIDRLQSTQQPSRAIITDGGQDDAKVIGHHTDGDGETYGVWGEVDSADGYGLATPNDARIAGNLAAGDEFHINLDTQFSTEEPGSSFSVFEPETVEDPTSGADIDASGSVLAGQLNAIWGGAVGAVVAGGGRDHEEEATEDNTVRSHWGTVSGGAGNRVGDHLEQWDMAFGTVGGGQGNDVRGKFSTVGGGVNNEISDSRATIAGGQGNEVTATRGTVSGGSSNTVTGSAGTISGGSHNDADAGNSTVGGGQHNEASGEFATVGGGGSESFGDGNVASGDFATVGGGEENEASGEHATVGGGVGSKATELNSTVAGGVDNSAIGWYTTIGGGERNVASAPLATVGGGRDNEATDNRATVSGGISNTATASSATVGGGVGNDATGESATVPGGGGNEAGGEYSFAAGRFATAEHNGAFVFGDSSTSEVASGGADEARFQMEIVAEQGVDDQSARAAKTNVAPVEPEAVLDGVQSLDVASWEYKDADGDGEGRQHIGPMAEDFHDAFDVGGTPDSINSIDRGGVALAAIQGLAQELEQKDERIDELETENEQKDERIEAQAERIDDLAERIDRLEGN